MYVNSLKFVFFFLFLFYSVFFLNNIFYKVKINDIFNNIDMFKIIDKNVDYFSYDNIIIDTPLYFVKINLYGGDIEFLFLKKHLSDDKSTNMILLNKSKDKYYLLQSGILSNYGPDSKLNGRSLYKSIDNLYFMNGGNLFLEIVLSYNNNNVEVLKKYLFKSYSYDIFVKYFLFNCTHYQYKARIWGQIKKKNPTVKFYEKFFSRNYSYFVFYDNANLLNENLNNLTKKKTNIFFCIGWFGLLEHYFMSIFKLLDLNEYMLIYEKIDRIFNVSFICKNEFCLDFADYIFYDLNIYLGPKDLYVKIIDSINIINYGFFLLISFPLFLVICKIQLIFKNWGLSIILITLIIKLLFLNLSSISYKSISKIRKIQPFLNNIKIKYNNDKNKYNREMVNVYKKNKINPLSGCLPLFLQIPVFFSLYYVIGESIEFRHAKFIFWINDLSSYDIFYIMPIIMSLTVYVQQKINLNTYNSLHKSMVNFIPIILFVLFMNLPSGLILYWIVNNILSIIHQWYILNYHD